MHGSPCWKMHKPPLLLFDGECNLCSGTVRWVLRHERGPALRFAALQSKTGAAILDDFDLPRDVMDTLVLVEGGRAYVKSEAVLRLARYLRWPWSWLRVGRLLPRAWRDALYDYVARHRYAWFGKSPVCLIPTPELADRFFD
ncbi:MAG TPA: thiol-disulfide oxidoreductase DCC family protein [Anaerolineae bacterium]|nr:thiol-disulfide oxidoreductase DCC family protein [Anaerolineae bacterium]